MRFVAAALEGTPPSVLRTEATARFPPGMCSAYISTGCNAEGLLERQRATASAVKIASAIQIRAKVSIWARRNGS
jgi:hypothetical protein